MPVPSLAAPEPSGATTPACSTTGPPTSATDPFGPAMASSKSPDEILMAGAKLRPPSVERARNVSYTPPPRLRGTITSTTPGAGRSTLTRWRL